MRPDGEGRGELGSGWHRDPCRFRCVGKGVQMDFVGKLVSYAIGLGFVLLSLGKLPEATLWLAKQAAAAQSQMISLGKLNRALMSGGRYHAHVK